MTVIDKGILQAKEIGKKAEKTSLPNSLGALISSKAIELGNQPACVFIDEGEEITYFELDNYSNKLANSLLQMGVRKGTHVAVMIPNLPEFPITWMAIAKIGAVIVPINVHYTPEELGFVLNDSDAQFLIIHENYRETFLSIPQRPKELMDSRIIVCGNNILESWCSWKQLCKEGNSEFTAPIEVTLSDLCNIQYTSGTTGVPKGCMLTHHYWILMTRTASLFYKGSIKNVLCQYPFFYMEPQLDLLMAFFHNATIYIPKRASLKNFLGWVNKYRIHHCAFPYPILKIIPPSDLDENELKTVRAYKIKGEAHFELEKRFNLIGRDLYGMTEIGLGTYVPEAATHMVGTGSCGLPAPFRELRIVNNKGDDVLQGEIGEIWVAGPGMFWGYYKRPEANASSFRGKWFRTGDLGRQDKNGYFYIVGRIKEVIRRSGESISASEVETVLEEIPEIVETAAIPVPDELRGEEVKVYVKLRDGLTIVDVPPEKIFEFCSTKLAKFKIPRYLGYIKEFPRTSSSGKIAKQLLIKGGNDLRSNAFDRIENKWR